MDREELRSLCLYWLDDLNAGYFTPPQVNTFLNNGLKEVAKRLVKASENYYLKCVTTPLVANQRDYVLPQDFLKVQRLEIITGGTAPNYTVSPLSPITINQQDLMALTDSYPSVYYIKKSRITVLPTPSTAATIRMWYTYVPVSMTEDTDTPDCPERYQELIACYAARDGFIKDDRGSDLLERKIKQYEDDMDADAKERSQDSGRQVIYTGNDSIGVLYW
jgi:hypothetical protein